MESLGQIPLNNLSDREILLFTYQEMRTMSRQFENYKDTNDKQSLEVDKRLDAIERQMQEDATTKKISDKKSTAMYKWITVSFTAVNITLNIIFYYLNHKNP